MSEIKKLENKYSDLKKQMFNLSNEIIKHLHDVFDDKLESYNSWNDFLSDINYYAAGDTFGKLMYINHAKNTKKFVD